MAGEIRGQGRLHSFRGASSILDQYTNVVDQDVHPALFCPDLGGQGPDLAHQTQVGLVGRDLPSDAVRRSGELGGISPDNRHPSS